jgi:hypothetical protein
MLRISINMTLLTEGQKLLALTDQFCPALVQAAAICSGLGGKDRAFELMERALRGTG